MKNQKNKGIWKVIGVLLAIMVGIEMVGAMIDNFTINRIEPEYVAYTVLSEALENKEVYALYTDSYSYQVRFQYKADISEESVVKDPNDLSIMDLDLDKWYYTYYVDSEDFSSLVLSSGTPVIAGRFTSRARICLNLILNLLPMGILGLAVYFMFQMVSSQMKMGENKFEISKATGITFSDVIGQDEVIEDVKNYIAILQSSKTLVDVKPPKGILFTGAPGTGKTLLAKAMAGEAKVPFIYLNTSSVIELFVGQGAKAIRSCFKRARELSPCVVFLDEIDAIGNKRGAAQVSSSEDTQTLLALLQELDGFKPTTGILVIAATNCPDNLDPALRRAGRFDREIIISLPRNKQVRLELLQHYTKSQKLSPDVDLESIAATLSGMSGADIATICNEAALIYVMRCSKGEDATGISTSDFTQAVDKLMLKGNRLKNKSLVNQRDREIVAYHEAGHAVMSYLCHVPISRISIQGTTSGVGGFVLPEDKDSQFRTASDLLNRVLICYAGRCSEAIKFGEGNVTTGASNDIQQATELLCRYIGEYGFGEASSMLNLRVLAEASFVDSSLLHTQLVALSDEWAQLTLQKLEANYQLVEALAQQLLSEETLLGADVEGILSSAGAVNEVTADAK